MFLFVFDFVDFKSVISDLLFLFYFPQGFDPEEVGEDLLYYLDPSAKSYAELTPEVHKTIVSEKMRF